MNADINRTTVTAALSALVGNGFSVQRAIFSALVDTCGREGFLPDRVEPCPNGFVAVSGWLTGRCQAIVVMRNSLRHDGKYEYRCHRIAATEIKYSRLSEAEMAQAVIERMTADWQPSEYVEPPQRWHGKIEDTPIGGWLPLSAFEQHKDKLSVSVPVWSETCSLDWLSACGPLPTGPTINTIKFDRVAYRMENGDKIWFWMRVE